MAADNNSSFQFVLEKEKLNGANFIDWYRNLRIVLRKEQRKYVLEQPYPNDLPDNAINVDRTAYEKHIDDAVNMSCLMLATMSPDLKKQYEHTDAYNMIGGLRGMFEN